MAWEAPRCERYGDRLAGLRDHIGAGGLTQLSGFLGTPEAAADLRAILRIGADPGLSAALSTETTPDAQPAATPVATETDTAKGFAFVDAIVGELLAPPPGQSDANGTLEALRIAVACGDESAWRLISTVLRDPRTATTLHKLATAVLRPTADKQQELTPVGLHESANFLQLANTLLRSLADPEFDPTTLLDLLSNLATSPDGVLTSLGDGVQLLVTAPSGIVDPQRRAQTAQLLTCARSGDDVGALPWLLHGLLIRQPGLASKVPAVTSWGTTLHSGALLADALAANEPGRAALIRLLRGAMQPTVLGEARALLRPPLSTEIGAFALGLAEAATCADR